MRSSHGTENNNRRQRSITCRSDSPIVLNAAGGDLKGEINLIWEPDQSAKYYLVQRSPSAKKPYRWKIEDIVSTVKYTVSNLKSNKNYIFRIGSVNESGKCSWSRPVVKKAP